MCWEDYKLGMRLQPKVTNLAAAGTLQLPGNKQRVRIMVIPIATAASAARIFLGTASTDVTTAVIASTFFNTDLNIMEHGSLVQEAMNITAPTGSGCTVIEFCDPHLNEPPPPGNLYDNLNKLDTGYKRG